MKRHFKHQANLFIMFIMVQIFFAACTQEEIMENKFSGNELQINVTTVGYIYIASGTPETRATDNGYATTFADGNRIGVIAVQGDAVVLDNIPYTYNGETWATSDDNKMDIPPERVVWLVYYPYSSDMDGKKTEKEIFDAFIASTIPADQGDQDKYTGADLMMWSGDISGNTLAATLTHRLAMVEINLPAEASSVKLSVNSGATLTPWNIDGMTWRCLVEPAPDGATLSGMYRQESEFLTWQQENVPLVAGKYTQVNVAKGKTQPDKNENKFNNENKR
jgi:hypothetical protein